MGRRSAAGPLPPRRFVTLVAVVLSLASAGCYAMSSVMQSHAARQEVRHPTLDPRILLHLLRRPLWLAGWIPDVLGTGLQAGALRFGPISLVQPVLASGLFLAIPLEAALDRRRTRRVDLLAVGIGAAGLAVFLAVARPGAGLANPSLAAWIVSGSACVAVVVLCIAAARFAGRTPRSTLLGIATGVLYALTAALLKTCTTTLTSDPLDLLGQWQLYALLVAGLAGLVLNQNAFQPGPLAAPLTALTLADPVTSVVLGVAVFHERLDTGGPRLAAQILAGLAMAAGIALAGRGRSGELAQIRAQLDTVHDLGGAERDQPDPSDDGQRGDRSER